MSYEAVGDKVKVFYRRSMLEQVDEVHHRVRTFAAVEWYVEGAERDFLKSLEALYADREVNAIAAWMVLDGDDDATFGTKPDWEWIRGF